MARPLLGAAALVVILALSIASTHAAELPAAYGSIYGNVKCSADLVLSPKSTGDVAAALAMLYARKVNSGINVKVRATHK